MSKKSIFGRLSSALGIGKGKPAVAKPKGGGRIRPKDQLQALEQALEDLKKEQQDLLKEIEVKGAVVDKMDSVLSMKTEVMEEIKLSNVSLDSQLQEVVQRKLVDQLGSMALEERGKATSIPSIMLGGGASEQSPAVDAMLQNWKYSIERLTQVLNDASAAGETTTKETVASVELQIQNILNFIINSLSSTAGASLIGLIKRGLLEAAAGNPDFVMEKYRRISSVRCPLEPPASLETPPSPPSEAGGEKGGGWKTDSHNESSSSGAPFCVALQGGSPPFFPRASDGQEGGKGGSHPAEPYRRVPLRLRIHTEGLSSVVWVCLAKDFQQTAEGRREREVLQTPAAVSSGPCLCSHKEGEGKGGGLLRSVPSLNPMHSPTPSRLTPFLCCAACADHPVL